MYAKLNHYNLDDCATKEDLVQLFETAFTQWKKNPFDPVDRRGAPRLVADHVKPLFVVSFSYDGKEVELNRRVSIVDISADGLGVEMEEPLPVGATLCFAFKSQEGDRNFGIASVVRLVRDNNNYHVGLTFLENARTLNIDQSAPVSEPYGVWLWKGLRTWLRILHALITRQHAHQSLQKMLADKQVRFDVEAKMFRYIATLYVDGRKVKTQIGPLNDRLRNLYSEEAMPTVISLEADAFVAWATLRTNKVCYVSIQNDSTQKWIENVDDQDGINSLPPEKTLMTSLKDIESNLRSLSVP